MVDNPVILTNEVYRLFFPFPLPSEGVGCCMKIVVGLFRVKGRDYYDRMFLLLQTKPGCGFLSKRCRLENLQEFRQTIAELLKTLDLKKKQKS